MKLKSWIYILIVAIVFSSCTKKDDSNLNNSDKQEYVQINEGIYHSLKEKSWYLWYNEIPEGVSTTDYSDNQEYLDKLLAPKDKWSFIITQEQYEQIFLQGENIGYGFSTMFDIFGNLRITFVYDDAPAGKAGLKRGDIIKSINGKIPPQSNDQNEWNDFFGDNTLGFQGAIKYETTEGESKELTISKGTFKQNTVLHSKVIDIDGKKTGYLVFQSFIEPSKAELRTVFQNFQSEGVKSLIIDLRYNGGGQIDIADYIANVAIGHKNIGKIFQELAFNETKTDYNEKHYFKSEDIALDIEKILFITTNRSASASECLINGLKPHIEVKTIGTKSHGKPVGMSGVQILDKILFAINFKVVNSLGDGDYFDGIPVDAEIIDDITHDWGNEEEMCLKEAVYYLKNGSFSGLVTKQAVHSDIQVPYNGIRAITGSY